MKMTSMVLVSLLAIAGCKSNETSAQTTTTSDNTKVNERDRHDTVTPTDQGNSKAETDITAAVRKGVMADDSLSFDAKNAKIVTTGTKVTLRGPVKSDQERAALGQIAQKTAGVTVVDNQLEVTK